MAVESINNLLSVYTNITPPRITIQKEVIRSIKKTCNVNLCEDDIYFKKDTLYINTSPDAEYYIIKNKKEIFQKIKSLFGNTPKNIRFT